MVVTNLVIHVASDSLDPFLLFLTQVCIVMGSFSSGVSVVFLVDFFKRRGWVYPKKKKPKPETDNPNVNYESTTK